MSYAVTSIARKLARRFRRGTSARLPSASQAQMWKSYGSAALMDNESEALDDSQPRGAPAGGPRRPRLDELRRKLNKEKPQIDQFKPSKNKVADNDIIDNESSLRELVYSLPTPHPGAVLRDRFQRNHTYLRLSLTERCNLRCTYCMPLDGVPLQQPEHLLTTNELLSLASHFRRAGVTKFRLTGGEPTLRHDLLDIIRGLAELKPGHIGMTTNGVTLHRNLDDFVEAGLTHVNISLDTIDPEHFARLTRRPAKYLDRVMEALHATQRQSNRLSTKLNCVVVKDENVDQIPKLIDLTKTFPHLSVRFIEFMPFSDNGWELDRFVSHLDMIKTLPYELVSNPSDDPHDTTKYFTTPWGGNVGFITSMSNHFCGDCNRLRLGADGTIKVCLFDGSGKISLRDALRQGFSQGEIFKLVHAALQTKHYALGGHKDPQHIQQDAANNRPMTLIGG